MMEAVRTSETSVENHFTRQYIPEDNSEHRTRRRENFKSQTGPGLQISVSACVSLLNILHGLFEIWVTYRLRLTGRHVCD